MNKRWPREINKMEIKKNRVIAAFNRELLPYRAEASVFVLEASALVLVSFRCVTTTHLGGT